MERGLKFNEFLDKLQEVKDEFRQDKGVEAITIKELESYLKNRRLRTKGRRHLTTLKGFNF